MVLLHMYGRCCLCVLRLCVYIEVCSVVWDGDAGVHILGFPKLAALLLTDLDL